MTVEVCEVIITGPDADWLTNFTHKLVADRLSACGHNISHIRSVYRWQGAIHDQTEARVALHTRRELLPEIVARTTKDHPYEVPCIIVLPISGGNPAYLQWIAAETREAQMS
ncbi:divalent-cation tolerance protein CutA [Pilimelia columellifera]|uniref:Divalent-cation tolerance protein CutA n=1 Tax=Pilimelia columellifera subsp. columellifera TaxID=706583 RepID=A0ABP6A3B1_9ACTN